MINKADITTDGAVRLLKWCHKQANTHSLLIELQEILAQDDGLWRSDQVRVARAQTEKPKETA